MVSLIPDFCPLPPTINMVYFTSQTFIRPLHCIVGDCGRLISSDNLPCLNSILHCSVEPKYRSATPAILITRYKNAMSFSRSRGFCNGYMKSDALTQWKMEWSRFRVGPIDWSILIFLPPWKQCKLWSARPPTVCELCPRTPNHKNRSNHQQWWYKPEWFIMLPA